MRAWRLAPLPARRGGHAVGLALMRFGQLGGKRCVLLLQAAGLGLSRFQAGRGGSQRLLLGRQGFQMRLHLGLDRFQIVRTLFVVSLPVALPSGCVDKAAQTLVVGPAKDTFTRPSGDLEDFLDY